MWSEDKDLRCKDKDFGPREQELPSRTTTLMCASMEVEFNVLLQVRDVEDVSEESLSLFTMLEPKLGK